MPEFVRVTPDGIALFLRVTPGASRDSIDGIETRDDGQARLKVRVTVQPQKGKANKAVIALLAKSLGMPKSALAVVSGETARDKTVRIDGGADTGARVAALADGGS